MTAKISISLPEDDIAVLDGLIAEGLASGRSEAIRVAIGRVRESVLEAELVRQFAAAIDEDYDPIWDRTAGDGL